MQFKKLSATELNKKLAEKKVIARNEKRLAKLEQAKINKEREAELEALRLDQEWRNELLLELSKKTLELALERKTSIELSKEVYEELGDYLENDLGFKLTSISQEAHTKNFLNKKLRNLNTDEIKNLSTFLRFHEKNVERLEIFNTKDIANISDDHLFCEQFLIFLSRKRNEYRYHHLLESEGIASTNLSMGFYDFNKIVDGISNVIDDYIPNSWIYDENGYIYQIDWSRKTRSKNSLSWFNSENLYWIASSKGSLFFNTLLTQIESRIESLKSFIKFDLQEEEITTIKYDNDQECWSPIKAHDLLVIFDLLGYSHEITNYQSSDTKIKVKLSWA
jgi:hypothetical protein